MSIICLRPDAQKKQKDTGSPVSVDIITTILKTPNFWPLLNRIARITKPIVDAIGNCESRDTTLADCMLELIRCARIMGNFELEDDEDAETAHGHNLEFMVERALKPAQQWRWTEHKARQLAADLKVYYYCKAPFSGGSKDAKGWWEDVVGQHEVKIVERRSYISSVAKDDQSSPSESASDDDSDDNVLQPAFMQAKAKKVAAIMPGSANRSLAKKKITATEFAQRILPAMNTAIPLHIETNIKGGWKQPFPMTDLTPAACASTNKARDKKEDRQLIQRDGKFVLAEAECDDLSRDKVMSATDFLLASKNLVEAVKRWYTPESLRKSAGKNLKKHFKALFERDEFRRPDKFPRIAMYNTGSPSPDIWSDVVVKTSRIDANHIILKADPAKIVEMFNKAISDTVETKDSNLLTPITARSARHLKSGDLTLQLRTSEEVELIRGNTKEWLPRVAPGAWTHIPKFNVIVNGVGQLQC
ncbi:hypothetical protein B0H14DRAFT_3163548 [Mycena olivaceomarginata]|nr:hypothetical protein B0H14DRAFT_3163548 [Mycena olivaceomarginata]